MPVRLRVGVRHLPSSEGVIIMGMSHESCDHPRTPAGRAACRKSGGSGAAAPKPAGKARLVGVEPLSARGKVRRGPRVDQPSSRTRGIRAEHDLVDVPHVFSNIIRASWSAGYEVQTGHPYNLDQRRIIISSDRGWLTLVWRSSQPFGITLAQWRPKGTSIAKTKIGRASCRERV